MSSDISAAIVAITTIAQLPAVDTWLKVVAQSGFNAGLVVLLIWLSNRERESVGKERERNRRSIDRLTIAISELTLSMNFLPKQFHENATRRMQEIKDDHQDHDPSN